MISNLRNDFQASGKNSASRLLGFVLTSSGTLRGGRLAQSRMIGNSVPGSSVPSPIAQLLADCTVCALNLFSHNGLLLLSCPGLVSRDVNM